MPLRGGVSNMSYREEVWGQTQDSLQKFYLQADLRTPQRLAVSAEVAAGERKVLGCC